MLISISYISCDDIIFTDDRTLAEGYVIDKRTGNKLPHAKVWLMECQVKLLSSRCNVILDSTYTNADGYYRFRFKDRRKTDFGVRLADYEDNTVFPLPVTATTGHNIVDDNAYLIGEGHKNRFDFYAKPFTTRPITIKLHHTGYPDAFLKAPFRYFYFQGQANNLDTTLQVKVVPEENYLITLRLTGTSKADKIVEQWMYVEENLAAGLTIEL
jgi:hypothetical protein